MFLRAILIVLLFQFKALALIEVDITRGNLSPLPVAVSPLSVDKDSIDENTINREENIFSEQAKMEGKPENIIQKMVDGRMKKFFQENCLLEQSYIKDPDKKVGDLLTEAIAVLGENISVNRFSRFAIGEFPDQNNQD